MSGIFYCLAVVIGMPSQAATTHQGPGGWRGLQPPTPHGPSPGLPLPTSKTALPSKLQAATFLAAPAPGASSPARRFLSGRRCRNLSIPGPVPRPARHPPARPAGAATRPAARPAHSMHGEVGGGGAGGERAAVAVVGAPQLSGVCIGLPLLAPLLGDGRQLVVCLV